MRCLNCGEKVGWNVQICPSCHHWVVHDCARRRLILFIIGGILLVIVGIAIGIYIA